MKKGLVVLLSVLAFGLVPGYVTAQALSGWGQFGLPCLGTGLQGLKCNTAFYVGWLDSRDGVTIGRDRKFPPWGDHMLQKIPYRGLWLGARTVIGPVDLVGVEMEGGLLIDDVQDATFGRYPPGDRKTFTNDGLDSGYIQLSGRYRLLPTLEILAGYRWDLYTVQLGSTEDLGVDDFRINTHLPVLGVKVLSGFSDNHLSVQVTGTPIVFGDFRFHYWNSAGYASAETPITSGYMFETDFEYGGQLLKDVDLSLFGKWQHVYAMTGESTVSSTWGSVDGGIIEWRYSRSAWTLGIDIATEFWTF